MKEEVATSANTSKTGKKGYRDIGTKKAKLKATVQE
jgi:hypothetical protein